MHLSTLQCLESHIFLSPRLRQEEYEGDKEG